jgi:DNA-binding response OmpR family regulator
MPSVLIVDSDVLSVKLERTVLEADGWYVLHSPDHDHARALLATVRPDLIVTALALRAHAAVDRLKTAARAAFVAVTALGVDVARDAGCAGFVAKPIDVNTFSAQLRAFLGGSR